MIDKKRVEEILRDSQALMEGHFVLTSGKHAAQYMQCARISQYPEYIMELCKPIADGFRNDNIDVVVSPAVGGIIVGYETARQLGTMSMFTEREDGKMTFRRGFKLPEGARVLVAEDVITTGGSVVETIEAVKANGGNVVGVGLFVDRTDGEVDFGVKTVAAYSTKIQSFEKENCPLCKEGKIAPYKPGSTNKPL